MTMSDVFDDSVAPPKPRDAAMTSATEREAFDFVKSVYNETGVTPELQRVYDFYKNTQNERQPSETVAEALREIRAAVQDGNLSQGVRLDVIDKTALPALKGADQ